MGYVNAAGGHRRKLWVLIVVGEHRIPRPFGEDRDDVIGPRSPFTGEDLGRRARGGVDGEPRQIAKAQGCNPGLSGAPSRNRRRHVHHGSRSMSRKRRHGALCRRPSTGSRAASGVEFSFVSAVVATGASAFATSAGLRGDVSRFAALGPRTGSSLALGACSRCGRRVTAIASGTSSRLRK